MKTLLLRLASFVFAFAPTLDASEESTDAARKAPPVFAAGVTTSAATANDRVAMAEDTIQMNSVTVTESLARRNLARSMRDKDERLEAEKFKWTRGGLISTKKMGALNADIGLWPTLEHERFGKRDVQDVRLRIDVLHIRW